MTKHQQSKWSKGNNWVKKHMDRLHKPKEHNSKRDYTRKTESVEITKELQEALSHED